MSEPAIEAYLAQLSRALRWRGQRAAIADELRDHLEERLAELVEKGSQHEAAARTAVEEIGDAAALAAEFDTVSRDLRRRWIMRYASASLAAAVVLLLTTMAFWPENPSVPLAPRAEAQTPTAGKESPAARPRTSGKEENNARTEAFLAAHRMKADFKEATLRDFFDFLREFKSAESKDPPLQIWVDTGKLSTDLPEAPVTLDTPISLQLPSVRLDMMLELVLTPLRAGYYVDDGIVMVTTREAIETRMEVRVYNARDLLQLPKLNLGKPKPAGGVATPGAISGDAGTGGPPGVPGGLGGGTPGGGLGGSFGGGFAPAHRVSGDEAELIDVLTTTVKPESWMDAGGPGSIAEYRGMLVVTQTAAIHRELEQVLEMLRRSALRDAAAKDKTP